MNWQAFWVFIVCCLLSMAFMAMLFWPHWDEKCGLFHQNECAGPVR